MNHLTGYIGNRLKRAFPSLISILLLVVSLKGQREVSYNTTEKLHDRYFMMGVSLIDFNLGFPTLSFSGGADAEYYFKRFSGEVGFRYAYYDMKKKIIKSTNDSENELKNYADYRIGGRFHLVSKQGKVKMRAVTGYTTNGATQTTEGFSVGVPTRKIIALHFGYQHYNTSVKKRDKNIGTVGSHVPVIASDGTGIGEFESGTTLKVGMIYAGFSFIDIMHSDVNSSEGNYKYKWYRNVYFDVLYAPFIKVEDIVLNGNSYVVHGTGTKGFETSPIGGRFGFLNMSQKVYLRYEIGWLPGLDNGFLTGFFTQASIGFSIVKGFKNKPAPAQ